MAKPLKVGVTGGIGSGKSMVTKVFQLLGAPVYDADSRAKHLMEQQTELKAAICQLLGEEAYDTTGKLQRSFIARKVFADASLTEKINALVHPRVKEDAEQWIQDHSEFPYVVKEAALMFESGSASQMDVIVLVHAPESLRMERVLMRDPHRDQKDIRSIMDRQWPEEEKKKLAHEVLINDEQTLLLPQILKLHQKFISA
jgi:dephospho-CoA kinase